MGVLETIKDFAIRTYRGVLDGSLFPARLPDVRINPDALAAVGLLVLVSFLAWTWRARIFTLPANPGRSRGAWCST